MKINSLLAGVAALCCASTFFSCKDTDERLGLDNGTGPQVIVIDTFSVFTRTVPEDSFATSALNLYILGANNSTVYGRHKADIVVNFVLPSAANFTFPAGAHIDSVVLALQYAGGANYAGNLSTPLKINTYELAEIINPDSNYYSVRNFQTNPTPVGTFNGPFFINDSVKITYAGQTETMVPHLRLRLDDVALKTKLLNGTATDYATNTSLQSFLKGVRVTVDNTTLGSDDGSMVYMHLNSGFGGMYVYYNDSLTVKFGIDKDKSAFANTYNHVFTGTTIQSQFASPGNNDTCYLQSMAGSRILVEIPGLTEFFKSSDNYGIVGANLTFSAEDPQVIGSRFAPPSRLLLLSRDSANNVSLVADAASEPDLYKGQYDSLRKQYVFNLPRHLQFVMNEYKTAGFNYNRGFFLRVPSSNPVSGSHVLLDTRKGNPRGIKFRLHVIKVR